MRLRHLGWARRRDRTRRAQPAHRRLEGRLSPHPGRTARLAARPWKGRGGARDASAPRSRRPPRDRPRARRRRARIPPRAEPRRGRRPPPHREGGGGVPRDRTAHRRRAALGEAPRGTVPHPRRALGGRLRRPPALLGRRMRRSPHPARRGHPVPRLLAKHRASWSDRRRIPPHQRGDHRSPAPAPVESAERRHDARGGRRRRRAPGGEGRSSRSTSSYSTVRRSTPRRPVPPSVSCRRHRK